MRAFLAITLPPDIASLCDKIQSQVRALFPKSRVLWVRPENIHLTLAFLGDVTPAQAASLIDSCKTVRFSPFQLSLINTGAFPGWRNPKVLWIGYKTSKALSELQASITDVLAKEKIPTDGKPFHPHLTIGRVKEFHDHVPEPLNIHLSAQHPVNSFSLFQSELSGSGPRYTEIQVFPLK